MHSGDSERAYRETVTSQVFKACTQKINEIEKFGQRAIEKGEIVEILDAEVKRISDIIEGWAIKISLEEKSDLSQTLATGSRRRRGVCCSRGPRRLKPCCADPIGGSIGITTKACSYRRASLGVSLMNIAS